MNRSIFARLALVCTLLSTAHAFAAKDAPLETATKSSGNSSRKSPGKLIFADSFQAGELDPLWRNASGSWQLDSGAVLGSELAADQHAAVLTLKQPNRNSIVKFSFRLDGVDNFCFSLDKAAGGHLFRVIVWKDALAIIKDRDKTVPGSRQSRLAVVEKDFAPGKWYTMLVEIDGDRVSVRTDNGVDESVQDASFDVDKPGYRFVARGASVAFDDLKVWQRD